MNLLDVNDRPGEYPESWYAATTDLLPPLPSLEGEARADVCVVGGGFTGLSTAWHLARAGVDVVVVEAQRVGFGASGRNGGQVGSGHRLEQRQIEARVGPDAARRLWDFAEEAKALARELADRTGAEWRDGVVHAIRREAAVAEEHAAANHLRRAYGYALAESLDRTAIAALTGSDLFAGGSVDWGAGHLHPLRLAVGLARQTLAAGARIHEGTRALRLTEGGVETQGGRIRAGHVVLAANGYLGRLAPQVAARVMPINNFVLATVPLGDRMPLARPVAVADDLFVVNYWRPSSDGRLIFGGGENYGYRFPRDVAGLVRRRLGTIYPRLRDVPVDFAWGGTLAITRSRLPHLALLRPGLWSASGYSGHGVGLALLSGRLLSEAIRGERRRFDLLASLPNPPFPGGGRLRAPLLALAMSWFALRDRLGL